MASGLSEVTVVETDAGLSGAITGMLLADNGARVIVAGRTPGHPIRRPASYAVWDRGKEWDIAGDDDGKLNRLADRTDVIILAKDSIARRRDWDPAAGRPHLVRCLIGGYATIGDLGERPASDALVAARLGLCGGQPGWAEGPSYIRFPLASIGAALLAAHGIVAALIARRETGCGQLVETSLLAGALAMSARVVGDGISGERTWDWRANGPFPFYSAYRCADGHWLQLGCIHDDFARRATEAFGIAAAIANHTGSLTIPPPDTRDHLYELITVAIERRSLADWSSALEAADVPFAPIRAAADYGDDPQARVNGVVTVASLDGGTGRQPGPAIRFGDTTESAQPIVSEPREGASVLARKRVHHGPIRRPLSANRPLAGVRVLELANLIAGPMAGRILADLGAEVIKIEPPAGGDIARRNGSPAFLPLNSSKRGIAVDLRTEAGRTIGRRLGIWADVVINNMRPGVAERLGMGWDELRPLNPGLVSCHVSAFGSRGPCMHKPGLDPLAAALTGMPVTQGGAGGWPVYVQGAAVDHTAALLASLGVLIALHARARTGCGQTVETSLLDAAALINAPAIGGSDGDESAPDRAGSQYGPSALERIYRSADGWLFVSVPSEGHWRALVEIIGMPLAADQRFANEDARRRHDHLLAEALAARFRDQTTAVWLSNLQVAGIPAEPIVDGSDRAVLEDPLVTATGLIADVCRPTMGQVRMAAGWLRFDATVLPPPGPPPCLGEHTVAVLEEIGFAPETIKEWCTVGAVVDGGAAQ